MCDRAFHEEARRRGSKHSIEPEPSDAKKSNTCPAGRAWNAEELQSLPRCVRARYPPPIKKKRQPECIRSGEENPIYLEHMIAAMNEGCALSQEKTYHRVYKEFRRRSNVLRDGLMFQGPDDSFMDFFPPGYHPHYCQPIQVKPDYTCLRPVSPIQPEDKWCKKYDELRRHEFKVKHHGCMFMGPESSFPEFFPPGFEFDKTKEHNFTSRRVMSRCLNKCGGDPKPTAFVMAPSCRYLTLPPIGYIAQYDKHHHVWPAYCYCPSKPLNVAC